MAEFSDKPMSRPPERDITEDDYMEAKYVTRYLEEYLDSHVYDGKSLRDRVILNFKVDKVEKLGEQWTVEGSYGSQTFTLHSEKLIVATGLTSEPQMPDLAYGEDFQGKILHQKSFGNSNVLQADKVQNRHCAWWC